MPRGGANAAHTLTAELTSSPQNLYRSFQESFYCILWSHNAGRAESWTLDLVLPMSQILIWLEITCPTCQVNRWKHLEISRKSQESPVSKLLPVC